MLKRHSQILVTSLLALDGLVTCMAWMAAFFLRFETDMFRTIGNFNIHVPHRSSYLFLMAFIVPAALIANQKARLYEPNRIVSFGKEFTGILHSTIVTLMIFIVLGFLFRGDGYRISRTFLTLFALLNCAFLVTERMVVRGYLRYARAHGKNLRNALILGAGKAGQSLANAVSRNAWTGIQIKGFLDDRVERQGMRIRGVPVLGGSDILLETIRAETIDQIYIALPSEQQKNMVTTLELLEEETVDIFMLPDVLSMTSLKLNVSNFEGLPVINLRESPMYGWDQLRKRVFDVMFSLAAILFTGLPMLLIALAVRLSSKGPIFYRQERMGLDGKTFEILKFRSMRTGAEVDTGAVWAQENDPRRTVLGTFLRKTSLDELPQFFNVLTGHMSVVGPRPERPVFINEFKKTVPKYMLRHKIKAGITGWAQVNGWRGNTSLKKRIQFDIYYIENWSLSFDVYIILMTVVRGFINKNAY